MTDTNRYLNDVETELYRNFHANPEALLDSFLEVNYYSYCGDYDGARVTITAAGPNVWLEVGRGILWYQCGDELDHIEIDGDFNDELFHWMKEQYEIDRYYGDVEYAEYDENE